MYICSWLSCTLKPEAEYQVDDATPPLCLTISVWPSLSDHLCLTISVWPSQNGEVKCRIQNSAEDSLTCCAWNNDGQRFYVGGTRGQFLECVSLQECYCGERTLDCIKRVIPLTCVCIHEWWFLSFGSINRKGISSSSTCKWYLWSPVLKPCGDCNAVFINLYSYASQKWHKM